MPRGGYSLYSDDRDDRHIFLGVKIGDLVFFVGCSSEIYLKNKTSICYGIKTLSYIHTYIHMVYLDTVKNHQCYIS